MEPDSPDMVRFKSATTSDVANTQVKSFTGIFVHIPPEHFMKYVEYCLFLLQIEAVFLNLVYIVYFFGRALSSQPAPQVLFMKKTTYKKVCPKTQFESLLVVVTWWIPGVRGQKEIQGDR